MAAGFYRLGFPARAARAAGADVRLVMPADRTGIGGEVDSRTGKLVNLSYPPDADVIVLQRVAMGTLAQAIPQMRARGVAVVIDMDDDLTKIDPNNPAFWGFHAKTGSPLHNSRNAMQACLDATLVTVSSPALLRTYAPHGRGLVLENRVPAAYLDVKRPPAAGVASVGWGGSIHSHPTDLAELGPAVQRLVRDGIEYWGAGPDYHLRPGDDGLRRALGVEDALADQVATTGDLAFEEWPIGVATLGVGLAPLADTGFNAAKSWLKPLEYMALGVPWIGSPRAEYRRLQQLTKVGLLAKGPGDWYRQAKALALSPHAREEQAERGRAAVRDHQLTYEASIWHWIHAWEQAAAAR
jgi:hypothetical protein